MVQGLLVQIHVLAERLLNHLRNLPLHYPSLGSHLTKGTWTAVIKKPMYGKRSSSDRISASNYLSAIQMIRLQKTESSTMLDDD